jgi:hypothetical protein
MKYINAQLLEISYSSCHLKAKFKAFSHNFNLKSIKKNCLVQINELQIKSIVTILNGKSVYLIYRGDLAILIATESDKQYYVFIGFHNFTKYLTVKLVLYQEEKSIYRYFEQMSLLFTNKVQSEH